MNKTSTQSLNGYVPWASERGAAIAATQVNCSTTSWTELSLVKQAPEGADMTLAARIDNNQGDTVMLFSGFELTKMSS